MRGVRMQFDRVIVELRFRVVEAVSALGISDRAKRSSCTESARSRQTELIPRASNGLASSGLARVQPEARDYRALINRRVRVKCFPNKTGARRDVRVRGIMG